METEPVIVVEAAPDAALPLIRDGLRAFNRQTLGEYRHDPLVVTLRDASGMIVGGAVAGTHLDWLSVDFLWISAEFRGRRWGSRLLDRVEAVALERGATRAYLDTIEFQAVEFYQKRGYVEFGRIRNFAKGFDRVYLERDLATPEPSSPHNGA